MIELLSALAGGLLLSLAFPSFGFDFLAWVAFIPLFWSLSLVSRPNRAFLCGTVFGLGFFLVDLNWIYGALVTHGHFAPVAAVVVFLAMIAFLSLYPAGFAYIVALFANKGISPAYVAPFVWVVQEYARSTLFTGFPWDLAGYSQASRLTLLQVADVTGVYGISFLILLANATLWESIRSQFMPNRFGLRSIITLPPPVEGGGSQSLSPGGRGKGEGGFKTGPGVPILNVRQGRLGPIPWKLIAASVLAFALILSYGQVRIKQFSSTDNHPGGCAIGVLQGNIPQEVKWEGASREETFATYEKLGRKAVEQGAGLLIWPETSAPVVFGSGDRAWMRPGLISDKLGVPMLVGAPFRRTADGASNYYNSAFLVDSGMLRFRYDKMHLVPFGEYMPWSWLLPLGPGIAAREADYAAGEKMTLMRCRDCPPFSVLICYEAIFPELARVAVRNGARLLVNITNDGWFGATAAPHQHLAMAGLRSVENRVWLLRSANTGISAAFDPSGRMVRSLPLQHEGLFTVTVSEPNFPRSFYSRFGDVFAWGCVGVIVLLGISVVGLRGRRKSWIRT